MFSRFLSNVRRSALFFLLLIWLPVFATTGNGLLQQREQFLDAEKALKHSETDRFMALKRELADYPLAPYLDYQLLLQRLPDLTAEQFDTFREKASDTPLVSQLRNRWLDHLADRKEWRRYVSVYRPGNNSRRECQYIQGLLALGRKQRALDRVSQLWLSGESQPEACDPVFKAWREAGYMTDELVWRRILLAFERGNARLARYLGRFLGEAERPWLDSWLRIHQRPHELTRFKEFAENHPYRNLLLAYGLKRLSSRDPEKARSIWRQVNRRYSFEEAEVYGIERRLALAEAKDDYDRGRKHLSTIEPRADDASFHQQRVKLALANRDWHKVREWINAMPDDLRSSERWRYWLARSLETTGEKEEASNIFSSLAGERGYHGFLAADRLNAEYHLEHIALELPRGSTTRLEQIPALLRARELFLIDRPAEARREWQLVMESLKEDRDGLQSAAKLAQEWGWNDQAIFTLARTGYWDDLELRFPLEHQELIDKASQVRQLDNSWVFAVVRQESAFSEEARSPAGALGLMQLMPRTARFIARKIKRPRPKTRDLFDPRINIDLGTAYLTRVLNQFDGHAVLATAAYNAGPARVSNWVPDETMPADLWIETLPFHETRSYVQRVLAYQVIYDSRQGRKPRRLRELMPPVTPGKATGSKLAGV